jgi:hypothetical protein
MSDETISAGRDPETPFLTLVITPEPTEAERDGLVAALATLLSTSPPPSTKPKLTRSRWAMTGRREAMRPVASSGWGRRGN